MDPETERQLAVMIMEEAGRLRSEAERDGVAAYLAKPKIRGRANPQFLQATVRSIQQSNRIVEVNEMWRRRNVELEYEQARERRRFQRRNGSPREANGDSMPSDSEPRSRHVLDSDDLGDHGLKDEELDEFLHSRVKRGRGAVGSRMDETGPYLPSQTDSQPRGALMPDMRINEDWEEAVAGPVATPCLTGQWKRKKRDSNGEDCGEEFAKRRKHKNDKREEKEERSSREKKRKKAENSSRRRR